MYKVENNFRLTIRAQQCITKNTEDGTRVNDGKGKTAKARLITKQTELNTYQFIAKKTLNVNQELNQTGFHGVDCVFTEPKKKKTTLF